MVEKNKAVSVTVPFEFSGTSPAVKSGAGTLTKVMHEVEVEVLPAHIPSSLIVDISSLENVGDQILLKDIPLAEGSYTVDGESVVAVISSLRDESQEEGAAEIDFSQIQVQKKGKEVTEE
ncbi:MAG: hypothetical protein LRY46_02870 [Candidatus Pacebacteria bacterium]|nr:hypothetical protein [Candidatus Paceibacterota bacterium]